MVCLRILREYVKVIFLRVMLYTSHLPRASSRPYQLQDGIDCTSGILTTSKIIFTVLLLLCNLWLSVPTVVDVVTLAVDAVAHTESLMKAALSLFPKEHHPSSTYCSHSLPRQASVRGLQLSLPYHIMLPNWKRCVRNGPAQLTMLVLVAMLLSACAGTPYRRYLGIRPDAPDVVTPDALIEECRRLHPNALAEQAACEQYLKYKQWAQELAEAYRSRASLNEWSIYVAGTIALAGLSVVSGLGLAAAASPETIGLIGVSTGFTSGFFGFINNSARAGYYMVAANTISGTLAEANKKVRTTPTSATYGEATQFLADEVSKTANTLETKRYETAAAAAASQQLQEAERKLQEITATMETALLIRLDKEGVPVTINDPVVAVTSGIDLTKYKDRIRVLVDGQPAGGEFKSQTEITFRVPGPVPPSKMANVILYVHGLPVPGQRPLTYK